MNTEYQFEIVVTSLTLKKALEHYGMFRVTLVESHRQVDPNSACFQTEVQKIYADQKTVDLNTFSPFKFVSGSQVPNNTYVLKYQIKGLEDGFVHTIPLPVQRMINEFKKQNKQMLVQKYEAKLSTLEYKIHICKHQNSQEVVSHEVIKTQLSNPSEQSPLRDSESNKLSGSQSKSRFRPPSLNISKKEDKLKRFQYMSLSPVPNVGEQGTSPAMTKKGTFEDLVSPTLIKKVSSLPQTEIEKVDLLLKTHHRTSETDKSKNKGISYKLKIVIFMFIIGISFLLYDTISDRSFKRKTMMKKIQNKKEKDPEQKLKQPPKENRKITKSKKGKSK